MLVLAIDPGTEKSGVCIYDSSSNLVRYAKVVENKDVYPIIMSCDYDEFAIEMIVSYGMKVGNTTFETLVWTGKFLRDHELVTGFSRHLRISRQEVKKHFGLKMAATDKMVRAAIIGKFEPSGGGKVKQIGTMSMPGPLYGVSSHSWAALAVAITASNS